VQGKHGRNKKSVPSVLFSLQKTRLMAFKGRDPVRNQIVIDREIVNSFNYLGNLISYEKEVDIDNRLNNYLNITGVINHAFRPQKP